MLTTKALLLVAAVAAVGVFHTIVPDHWAPIALLARQRGWSRIQTAKAAAGAGLGHTISTLLIAIVVWIAGVAFASRLGQLVDSVASVALVAFGLWILIGALREIAAENVLHERGADHGAIEGHAHVHRHGGGPVHVHWHQHDADSYHAVDSGVASAPPLHQHEHATSARTALLLVLGSSPMIEGIPAFFAAAPLGAGLIAVMSAVFAAATIGTYIVMCVAASEGLGRLHLGPLERYGEALSGAIIAALGVAFWVFFR